jgi:hypothetical protein
MRKKRISKEDEYGSMEVDEILDAPPKIIKPKRGKKDVEYYVKPAELSAKIVEYYKSGNPDVMDESLATMVSKIANRLSFAPNFINYTYREDMIGDAIVKMFSALRNKKFKIEGDYNPFSYFTKIAFNAFCNRIKKEKRNREALAAYQEDVYGTLMDHGHIPHKTTTNPEED